jgi:PTS system nitrogen regulatory IIA component
MDLKIKDVAELLKVSETTVRRWLIDGKIPGYRLNHQYRFSRTEIENWMIRCKLKPTEEGFSFFGEKQIYPPINDEAQESVPHRGGMQQYGLYRAIHQGGVFLNVPGKTKEEIIRSTTQTIGQKLNVDGEILCELLLDREKLMPTALNNGIAIPHTRDFLISSPFDVVVVVFPEEPIEYGALDGKPVHSLFFLFASSDKRHLLLLAKIAHLCSDKEALRFLECKPDKKAILDYIRHWEGQLRHSGEPI